MGAARMTGVGRRGRGSGAGLVLATALAVALVVAGWPAGARGTESARAGGSAVTDSGRRGQVAAQVAPELREEITDAGDSARVEALVRLPDLAELPDDPAAVVPALKEHAAETQLPVEQALGDMADDGGIEILNRFWITNMLLVEMPADDTMLDHIAELPSVTEILSNFAVTAEDPEGTDGPANTGVTWGIERIQADRVWDEFGATGEGVRIATLDTGVDIEHPDLTGKLVTEDITDPWYPGGWMDFSPSGQLVGSAPQDPHGHGTHVSGTALGGDASGVAIGVAPGADLMHGRVLSQSGRGTFARVIAGMQWAIAPTDAAGQPAGEPADVVNMSLGAGGLREAMIAPTRALRAAGVFPAFSIGNAGLITTGSPGNVFDAVGVGATDINDHVAGFSSGGVINSADWPNTPGYWPNSFTKPDVSAPGVEVWSSVPDGGYAYFNGTSMAAPHTAGTAALLLSLDDDLSADAAITAIETTAVWNDRYAAAPPDIRYGAGRIDAHAAAQLVAQGSGIAGTVTDAASGKILPDVSVTISPGERGLLTQPDGRYQARLAPGAYSLTIDAFGYESATISDIAVTLGELARVDVTLQPSPRGAITGRAWFDETSVGLPGVTVRVEDVPVDLSTVTDANGRYRIEDVPIGTYTVTALEHPRLITPPSVSVAVPVEGTTAANFVFSLPTTVAIVGERVDAYRDLLATHGFDSTVYAWRDVLDAARHDAIVLTGAANWNRYDAAFVEFLERTDANGSGVVFADLIADFESSVHRLARATGKPTGFGHHTGPDQDVFYKVVAAHPVLADFSVNERIHTHWESGRRWYGWFDGYEGEGRQTIAHLGEDRPGVVGGGIGVHQRASNRHVIMASHQLDERGKPPGWDDDVSRIFINALNWVKPNHRRAHIVVHDLRSTSEPVISGEPLTVRADLTNIGSSTGTAYPALFVDGEATDTVTATLAAGTTTTVEWTLEPARLGEHRMRIQYMSGGFHVVPSQETGTITGRVTFEGTAEGVPGVTVRFPALEGIPSVVSGVDGGFTLSDAPAGTYDAVAAHPTFELPGPIETGVSPGATTRVDVEVQRERRAVALVSTIHTGGEHHMDQYRDEIFEPRGIPTDVIDWYDVVDASTYEWVVLGVGGTFDYRASKLETLFENTDRNGAGVVFVDREYARGSGIRQRAHFTG